MNNHLPDSKHLDRPSFALGIIVGVLISVVFVIGFLLVGNVTSDLFLG